MHRTQKITRSAAFVRGLAAVSLAFGMFGTAGAANATTLIVKILEVDQAAGGFLQADLYAESQRDDHRGILMSGGGQGTYAARVAVEGETAEIVIEGVEPGVYSVGVFQDANDDGVLNTQAFLPIPTECVGSGNNAQGSFGPPSFEASSIEVGAEDLTTTVNLDC